MPRRVPSASQAIEVANNSAWDPGGYENRDRLDHCRSDVAAIVHRMDGSAGRPTTSLAPPRSPIHCGREVSSSSVSPSQSERLNKKRGTRVLPVKFQPQENEPMAQSSRYGGGSDLADKATDQLKKVADRVEGVAGAAADQMRDVTDRTGEVARRPGTRMNKRIRSASPMGRTIIRPVRSGISQGAPSLRCPPGCFARGQLILEANRVPERIHMTRKCARPTRRRRARRG
jgi:hypothetical protein